MLFAPCLSAEWKICAEMSILPFGRREGLQGKLGPLCANKKSDCVYIDCVLFSASRFAALLKRGNALT